MAAGAVQVMASAPAARHRGWQTVAASSFGLALGPSAVFLLSFGALLPALRSAFGWTTGSIALGASIAAVMVAIVSPVQGWLVDRHGARRVILASLPTWALALLALALLPAKLGLFYLFCALLPVAGLGLWPLSFLQLPTTWFDRHLGLAIGMTNVGIGIGVALIPLLLAYGFAHWGWRSTYALLGLAVLLIVLPVCWRWMHPGPLAVKTEASVPPSERLDVRATVRTVPFWIILVTFVILGFTCAGMLVHQISILMAAGFAQSNAIYIQSLLGLGAIVGRLAVGWLLDIFDARAITVGVLAVAALAAVLFAFPGSVHVAVAGAVLLGLVIGAEFDVLVILIRRYIGLLAFGRIYGLVFGGFQLGSAAGSASLGFLAEYYRGYTSGLLLLCVLLALGAVLAALLGPPRHVQQGRAPA